MAEGRNFSWLRTEDWFEENYRFGNFIWDIPPECGDIVYELLDKAMLKRPETAHILLIPSLFTGLWRRLLAKRSDCDIRVDWKDAWDLETNFEPLLIFFCILFSINRSFEKGTGLLLENFQGTLQECRVSSSTGLHQRNLLRKILQCSREI